MTDSLAATRQSASSTSAAGFTGGASPIGARGSHGESHRTGHSEPNGEYRDRYAAVIAALIDVRPDVATARFDEELTNALADGRLDAQTARTLRWWQRASVRAAESYATAVVPEVLAARDRAEETAHHDADEAGAAWRAACQLAAAQLGPEPAASQLASGTSDISTIEVSTISADDTDDEDDGSGSGQPEQHGQPIVELAAVRLLQPARVRLRLATVAPAAKPTPTGSGHTQEHTQAIRAAFAGEVHAGAELVAPNMPTDLVATTVENQRKDRSHANPATSA